MKAIWKEPRQPELEGLYFEKAGKCTKSLADSLGTAVNSQYGESGLGKTQQFEAYGRPRGWGERLNFGASAGACTLRGRKHKFEAEILLKNFPFRDLSPSEMCIHVKGH